MTTREMQAHVYDTTGAIMRREEYARLNRGGGLASRHRWAIHDLNGALVCRGANPAQCFAFWKAQRAEKKLSGDSAGENPT